MKLRLGAAVLLAALIPLTAVTTPSPARAGVDTTPPAEGSCHTLTYDEGLDESDPDAAVPCTARHTSVTTKVLTLRDPDWTDTQAIFDRISPMCSRATLAFFDGRAKALQMSTYSTWIFIPTRVQREAGADWARCDVALYGYHSLKPLPTSGDPVLGQPPLRNKIAKCRKGRADDFNVTSCDKPHQYHATHAFKYPGDRYPGLRRMVRWTINKCRNAFDDAFYYEAATKYHWKTGYRFSVCLKKTSR